MGRIGDGIDDVAIQQLPTQPSGNSLRDAPAAASKLPVHRQHTVCHDTLLANMKLSTLLLSHGSFQLGLGGALLGLGLEESKPLQSARSASACLRAEAFTVFASTWLAVMRRISARAATLCSAAVRPDSVRRTLRISFSISMRTRFSTWSRFSCASSNWLLRSRTWPLRLPNSARCPIHLKSHGAVVFAEQRDAVLVDVIGECANLGDVLSVGGSQAGAGFGDHFSRSGHLGIVFEGLAFKIIGTWMRGLGRRRNQFHFGAKRKTDQVVELHLHVADGVFKGAQLMARFGDLRFAFEGLHLEHRAGLDAVAGFDELFLAGLDAQVGGLLAALGAEQAIVKLLDLERDLIAGTLYIVARLARVGFGGAHSSVNLEHLGNGLGRGGCGEDEILVAEGDGDVLAGDGAVGGVTPSAHGDNEAVHLAEVDGVAFIGENGEVVGAGLGDARVHLFGFEIGELYGGVLTAGESDGFIESDAAGLCLGDGGEREGEEQGKGSDARDVPALPAKKDEGPCSPGVAQGLPVGHDKQNRNHQPA